jgi:hypothetical protein
MFQLIIVWGVREGVRNQKKLHTSNYWERIDWIELTGVDR